MKSNNFLNEQLYHTIKQERNSIIFTRMLLITFLSGLAVSASIYAKEISKSNDSTIKSTSNTQTGDGIKVNPNDHQTYQSTDWELKNLKGDIIRLTDYQGQPVILVFWATWCPYCKKLLPGIEKLHQKYADKGLKVIGVNIKEDWKPKLYWDNHNYHFDTVLKGDAIAEMYGVKGTPGIVFIEPNGKLLAVKSFSDPEHPLLYEFAEFYITD